MTITLSNVAMPYTANAWKLGKVDVLRGQPVADLGGDPREPWIPPFSQVYIQLQYKTLAS